MAGGGTRMRLAPWQLAPIVAAFVAAQYKTRQTASALPVILHGCCVGCNGGEPSASHTPHAAAMIDMPHPLHRS
jgi:hypothetical protein